MEVVVFISALVFLVGFVIASFSGNAVGRIDSDNLACIDGRLVEYRRGDLLTLLHDHYSRTGMNPEKITAGYLNYQIIQLFESVKDVDGQKVVEIESFNNIILEQSDDNRELRVG